MINVQQIDLDIKAKNFKDLKNTLEKMLDEVDVIVEEMNELGDDCESFVTYGDNYEMQVDILED